MNEVIIKNNAQEVRTILLKDLREGNLFKLNREDGTTFLKLVTSTEFAYNAVAIDSAAKGKLFELSVSWVVPLIEVEMYGAFEYLPFDKND